MNNAASVATPTATSTQKIARQLDTARIWPPTSGPSKGAIAMTGFGLGFVMEDQVAEQLADRRLVRVLADWCPPFTGYHLYYPSRRQASAAFTLLVEALRFRGAQR